jgi:hypothetical protein
VNGEIARELIVAGLILTFGNAALIPVMWWEIRNLRKWRHEWSNVLTAHVGEDMLTNMGKGHLARRKKK